MEPDYLSASTSKGRLTGCTMISSKRFSSVFWSSLKKDRLLARRLGSLRRPQPLSLEHRHGEVLVAVPEKALENRCLDIAPLVERPDLLNVALDELGEAHAMRGRVVDEESRPALGFDLRSLGLHVLIGSRRRSSVACTPAGG